MRTFASEQSGADLHLAEIGRRIVTHISGRLRTSRQERARMKSASFLRSEIARLHEISPHLLIDIGVVEIENLPERHRKHVTGNGVQ